MINKPKIPQERLSLAVNTEKGVALPDDFTLNWATAHLTVFALSAVNIKMLREVARLTIGLREVF